MGGGGHHPEFKIPDYKIYKIDGIKELEWARDELAKKGLKDPWIRNEVWRYQNYPGLWANAKILFGRGMKWALAGMALTIGIDQAFGISKSRHEKHHGHASHH